MSNVTFIRIPKNASTSLYSFFGKNNTIRNEYIDPDNKRHINIFESSHIDIASAEKVLGSDILNYPVIAVIRNPYDRLVSMYFFAKKYNLGALYNISTEDFDNFAYGFYKNSYNRSFFHAHSQTKFISHERNNEFYIIRFENLLNDFNDFINKTNLCMNYNSTDLQKLNSTEHADYTKYYSNYSKMIVEDMWEDDLNNFSYSFGNR